MQYYVLQWLRHLFSCLTHSSFKPQTSLSATYGKHGREKIRQYEQSVREVECASFSPLVFSSLGSMGRIATIPCTCMRLASMFVERDQTLYNSYWTLYFLILFIFIVVNDLFLLTIHSHVYAFLHKALFEELSEYTGMELDLGNIYILYDVLLVEVSVCRKMTKLEPFIAFYVCLIPVY